MTSPNSRGALAEAPLPADELQLGPQRGRSPLHVIARFSRQKPFGFICAAYIVIIVLAAILANVIAPYPWAAIDNKIRLEGPSFHHLLGTDQFGRDVLSRMLRGSRVSLRVGFFATIIGVAAATAIGAVSAYAGGIVDYLIQRLVDVIQSVPPIILLISILVVLGPSINHIILALALFTGFQSSRIARGATLTIRDSPYVEAARALGCPHERILWRYILPNIFPPMIVIATISLGANILAEASLSFLGYGIPPPEPSWGGMLSSESRTFMTSAPWLLAAPSLALASVVFAANMLGDALRDVLDPRLRK